MSNLVNNRWKKDSPEYKRLERNARFRGATNFGLSNRLNKKYFVVYDGKKIHFGDVRFEDFSIHGDKRRRDNYRNRHKGVKLISGKPAYQDKRQPAYWAYWIIW
jgi:hypothetical protein